MRRELEYFMELCSLAFLGLIKRKLQQIDKVRCNEGLFACYNRSCSKSLAFLDFYTLFEHDNIRGKDSLYEADFYRKNEGRLLAGRRKLFTSI